MLKAGQSIKKDIITKSMKKIRKRVRPKKSILILKKYTVAALRMVT